MSDGFGLSAGLDGTLREGEGDGRGDAGLAGGRDVGFAGDGRFVGDSVGVDVSTGSTGVFGRVINKAASTIAPSKPSASKPSNTGVHQVPLEGGGSGVV